MKRKLVILAAFFIVVVVSIYTWNGVAQGGNQTTSSTLASSIIDQARKYLGDPTTHGGTQKSIWSDAEMLQWVNDGTLDIVSRTHCLEDTETETLVEGQPAYPLADPFIVIKYVIYNDDSALDKGSLADFNRVGSASIAGAPSHWCQWENNVVVYPAPDSTAAGNDIVAYVVDRTVDVLSSANVLVPSQYDKALVYYVTAQGWAKDCRMDLMAAFETLYLQELDRYRTDFSAQPSSSTRD